MGVTLGQRFLWIVVFFYSFSSYAGNGARHLTREEFQKLAEDLAPKVNLFRDVWEKDPNAEFFGGTSRDFLHWVKRQLYSANSPDEARRIAADLRAKNNIDVRDFIMHESDVDIVFSSGTHHFDAGRYGVKKIDAISKDRITPGTGGFADEINQGLLPVEKIRLSRGGFVSTQEFGDGVGEVYSGRVTMKVADPVKFQSTHYAQLKLNHEILLAFRYLRAVANDYYNTHGTGFPDHQQLIGNLDPNSSAEARRIIDRVANNPNEISEHLKQERFRYWLNQTVHKAFRSYTNPTAALDLYKHFGAEQIVRQNSSTIEPINQYLFAKPRKSDAEISQIIGPHGVSNTQLFVPVATAFPDGHLFHGTKDESAFKNILLQGIQPSQVGNAGQGLYGVNNNDVNFAASWGGSKDRVVRFKVKPDARIVDIRSGPGQKLFASLGMNYEAFAAHVGADILIYPYSPQAFVVKNSAVLERPVGHTRQVFSFDRLLEMAGHANSATDAKNILRSVTLSTLTFGESRSLIQAIPFFKNEPYASSLTTLENAHMNPEMLAEVMALKIDFESKSSDSHFFPIADEFFARWSRSNELSVEQLAAATRVIFASDIPRAVATMEDWQEGFARRQNLTKPFFSSIWNSSKRLKNAFGILGLMQLGLVFSGGAFVLNKAMPDIGYPNFYLSPIWSPAIFIGAAMGIKLAADIGPAIRERNEVKKKARLVNDLLSAMYTQLPPDKQVKYQRPGLWSCGGISRLLSKYSPYLIGGGGLLLAGGGWYAWNSFERKEFEKIKNDPEFGPHVATWQNDFDMTDDEVRTVVTAMRKMPNETAKKGFVSDFESVMKIYKKADWNYQANGNSPRVQSRSLCLENCTQAATNWNKGK